MPIRSLEKERAQLAWAAVSSMDPSLRKNYYSLIRRFPSMVQTMGIGQSVAFLMAKSEDHHTKLLEQLKKWLFTDGVVPWTTQPKPKLIDRLTGEEIPVWWHAEREAIELSIWLKRFTESFQNEGSR